MEVIKTLISHRFFVSQKYFHNLFDICVETFASALVQKQQLGVELIQREGTEVSYTYLQMPAESATKSCT